MTNASFYYESLYPFQDAALKVIRSVDTGIFLTGGTAASRGYLHHRFSDDLDLFVSDDDRFGLWVDRIIQALVHGGSCSFALYSDGSRLGSRPMGETTACERLFFRIKSFRRAASPAVKRCRGRTTGAGGGLSAIPRIYGYHDPAYFNRAYMNLFGVPPIGMCSGYGKRLW